MTEHRSKDNAALIPTWEEHRTRILSYGHALHGLLPDGDPPVTIHGRDMRIDDEGVGTHFQYTLIDDLYDGTVVSACFALQIELVGSVPTSVRVDAVPLLEHRDGTYDIIGRRHTTIPLVDTRAQWLLFAYSLRKSASEFFTLVRAGEPIENKISGFSGSSRHHG